MAKTDLKSAFSLNLIHPDDWSLLGIYWQSQYYVDMYLPFGLRSAPFLFNQLSDALEWIDNESVVSIINSGHSKVPRIMELVRKLVLLSMQHNFLVQARHFSGISNEVADALSRFQIQRFRALASDADQSPCII